MKNDTNIFRLWSLITLLFAVLVLISVVILMAIRFSNVASLSKMHIKTIVERKIHYDLPDITEEIYLELDNIDLRQRDVQDLLDNYGKIHFQIESKPSREKIDSWEEYGNLSILKKPLKFGDRNLGTLIINIEWTDTWSLIEGTKATFQVLALCIILGSLWFLFSKFIQIRVYEPVVKKLLSAQKDKAIAQTTQMLAHDVRKPFTMLQGVLSMISRAESLNEVRTISRESLPEIERGINSVNGMIQDVMEVGSSGKLSKEEANPETIIETTVTDSFRYQENVEIALSYELSHKNKINIDILKTSRVFANIIGNGAQAMEYSGRIWFKTTAARDGLIQFTIGNSNSYIPPEKIKKLFDAFFTSGKKDGTGLGLAIAKKVVEGHGGKIWCTSSETEGTEFHFTLPALDTSSDYEGELPVSAEAIRSRASMDTEATASSEARDANEWLFEQEIIRSKEGSDKPISILLVDDEKLYITVLKNQLTCNKALAQHISFGEASSGEEALVLTALQDFDVIILDVDMGKCNLSGFDTAHKLRQLGVKATICIHSNRGGSEYYKKAMDSGADMFIGKTMPREHFLRMIYGVVGDPHDLINSSIVASPEKDDAQDLQEGCKIILVEDNKIIRGAWKSLYKKGTLISFESPERLMKAISTDSAIMDGVEAVVIDNNFDALSDMNGFDLAKALKAQNISPKLVISTGDDFSAADIKGVFDLMIPKNPADGISVINQYLSKNEGARIATEDKSQIDKKKLHDIQNCFTCLRILADDLENDEFSADTYTSIEEYSYKLDKLTDSETGVGIRQLAKENPKGLSKMLLDLSQESWI